MRRASILFALFLAACGGSASAGDQPPRPPLPGYESLGTVKKDGFWNVHVFTYSVVGGTVHVATTSNGGVSSLFVPSNR